MSDPVDDTTTPTAMRVRRALAARGEQAPYDTTPVADVVAGARRLRRRRRATGTAALVVVAVGVAVPVVAVTGDASAPVVTTPDVSTEPPGIGYAVDRVYHAPDGTQVALPFAVAAITPVTPRTGGDVIAVRDIDSVGDLPYVVARVDRSGSVVERWCSGGPAATSPDGRTTAWTVLDCDPAAPGPTTLVRIGPDGRREQEVAAPAIGRGSVVVAGVQDDGTVRLVESPSGRVLDTELDQPLTPIAVPGTVTDFDPVSGRTTVRLDDDPLRGAVVADDGSVLVRIEDDEPFQLAPGAGAVVAGDGERAVLLDASGTLLAILPGTGHDDDPATRLLAWEDETHLLAQRVSGEQSWLVRVDLDGTLSGPLPGPDLTVDDEVVWEFR